MIKKSCLDKEWYTPGDVAKMLGVVPMTVIGYDNRGILKFERSSTNRRIISKESLLDYFEQVGLLLDDSQNVKFDAIYSRVSTQVQFKRGDLDSQINVLLAYCATQDPVNLQIYKDIGSGLNDNRKDLLRLINDIEQDKVNRLFITYKDRLTRFGFNYLNQICKNHNTEIILVSSEVLTKTVQEELAEDLCAIVHSFSGKLYGLRRSQLKEINSNINSIKEVSENEENDTG